MTLKTSYVKKKIPRSLFYQLAILAWKDDDSFENYSYISTQPPAINRAVVVVLAI